MSLISPYRTSNSPLHLDSLSTNYSMPEQIRSDFECDGNNPSSTKKLSHDMIPPYEEASAIDLKILNFGPKDFRLRRPSSTDTSDSSSGEEEGHSFSFVSNGTRKFNAPEVAFSKRGASPKNKMFASSSSSSLNPNFPNTINLDRPQSPNLRPKSTSSSVRGFETDTSSLVKMYLELKDAHSELLEQHEATLSQNESMKHSVIALERALADSRASAQSSADASQTEALKLANSQLKDELRRRCKEVQDLLIARNLPLFNQYDRDDSTFAHRVSCTAPLEQLQAISAKNDELSRELENTKLQLAFERRRREQVEDEVQILRSLNLQGRSQHPIGKGGPFRVHNQHLEAIPASPLCHGANPIMAMPLSKTVDHQSRIRNVIEPKSSSIGRYRSGP